MRAVRQRALPLAAGLVLVAIGCAALFALWNMGLVRQGEIDVGQYMVRHLRYTYAEVVNLDRTLEAATLAPTDERALALVSKAADRFHVRLEMLSGLSRGPMVEPGTRFAPLARALSAEVDALVREGIPLDERRLAALRASSAALVRETGDYTRGLEAEIDAALRVKATETSSAWLGVLGSVLALIVLSALSLALVGRNRAVLSQLRLANGRDSLTGCANRRGFRDWAQDLSQETAHDPRQAGGAPPHAVLVFDLDRFKDVNDRLGHPAGDAMLKRAAHWLQDAFGAGGIVARWGGDEFVVATRIGPGGLADVLARLAARAERPLEIELGGETVPILFSCGIAVWPQDAATIDEAITCADAALYAVKEGGRNGHMVFRQGLLDARDRVLETRAGLARALSEGELFLQFQPQVDVVARRVVAAEALVRWRCGRTGRVVPPSEFIPVAEQSGQIAQIDGFVLEEACRAAAAWRRAGVTPRVAINLSPHSFRSADLAERVATTLLRHKLVPADVEIEITEGVLLSDSDAVARSLTNLGRLGVRLALDDFGTGYSNIAYLARLKPSLLKIDRSFLAEGDLAMRTNIVEGVMRLAQTIGAETLMEGIETREQLAFATRTGCRLLQGFLFARPMQADAIPAFCGTVAHDPQAGTRVALAS
ncbi:putative bifunctional diguanylate cyclase/phosphodiesterase [Salinarimonas ramus]|nr:bifunctional diguanylate cyclase/phosphodiesterase [Salinarimonas ramus]